jgi:hypothetical protein
MENTAERLVAGAEKALAIVESQEANVEIYYGE